MAKHVVSPRVLLKHEYPKKVVPGKIRSYAGRIFKIEKGPGSKLDILLVFAQKVDYQLVTLSTRHLPRSHHGRPITWLTCFGFRNRSREYVRRVKYTAFFSVPRGATLVRFQDNAVQSITHRGGSPGKPSGKEVIFVDFESGDPGIGVTRG